MSTQARISSVTFVHDAHEAQWRVAVHESHVSITAEREDGLASLSLIAPDMNRLRQAVARMAQAVAEAALNCKAATL